MNNGFFDLLIGFKRVLLIKSNCLIPFAVLLQCKDRKCALGEGVRSEQSAGACRQAGAGLALACEGGASDTGR